MDQVSNPTDTTTCVPTVNTSDITNQQGTAAGNTSTGESDNSAMNCNTGNNNPSTTSDNNNIQQGNMNINNISDASGLVPNNFAPIDNNMNANINDNNMNNMIDNSNNMNNMNDNSNINMNNMNDNNNMINNNMNNVQHNHSVSLPEGCPSVDVKLFVARLSREMEDDQLKAIFEPFGAVTECVILRDKESKQHKGSGFVRMATIKDADAAITSLHNLHTCSEALGPVQVRYATGEFERLNLPESPPGQEAKLFVGSLPRTITDADVREIFDRFGEIAEIYLLKDTASGQGKGCAFVKFTYKECAFWAIEQLNGKYTVPGFGRPLEVRFAEAKKQVGMASVPQMRVPMTFPYQYSQPQGAMVYTSPAAFVQPQGAQQAVAMVGMPAQQGGVANGQGQQQVAGNMVGMQQGTNQQGIVNPNNNNGNNNNTANANANGQTQTAHSNANPRIRGVWTEYFTPENRPYYYNENTKATTWETPQEFVQLNQQQSNNNGNNMQVGMNGGMNMGMNNQSSMMLGGVAPMMNAANNNMMVGGAMGGQNAVDVAGPPGANVFIFHVPNEWTTSELVSSFSHWGTIVSARVAVDKATQRNKGYAFVSYDNVVSAANAVQNMNGFLAGSKRLKVSIKQGEEQHVQHLLNNNGGAAAGVGNNGNANNQNQKRTGPY